MKTAKELPNRNKIESQITKQFPSKEEAFKAKHDRANDFAKKVKFTF